MEKSKRKEKQVTLVGFIKRLKVDLNVKHNEMVGGKVKIPKENDKVKKKSTRAV